MRKKAPFRFAYRDLRLLALTVSLLVFFGAAHDIFSQEPDSETDAALEYFAKGQDAHEKGDLANALSLYEKAIAVVVEFPEAEYQRGQILLSQRKPDLAEEAFRKALKQRPEWSLPMTGLAGILINAQRYDEAGKLLERSLSLDDANFAAYAALTELRLSTNAGRDSLTDLYRKLTGLTAKAKTPASIWAARAAVESALGDRSAAKISYERALELEPNNRFALLSKLNTALDEDDEKGAVLWLGRLEASTGPSTDIIAAKARLLLLQGKGDEAVRLLDTVKDAPQPIIVLRERIRLSSLQDPAELEKRLEDSPNDKFILGRLCSAYRIDDPEKALTYCRKASEASPNDVVPAIGYGAALVQAKMFEPAIELLRKLQPSAPDNVSIRANLAISYFQLKRYAEAKTEYRWIADKQPDSPIAYYFLGISHDHLKEYMDALANYQQFLRLADPEKNQLEIDKVNLRLPILQKQLKDKKGKRN